MKKMNEILKRCKSLSSKLGRSSSCSSLRIKSTRSVAEEDFWGGGQQEELVERETIYVGSSKRRYLIKAKLLDHPLVNALIERSSKQSKPAGGAAGLSVKCEVVIFDHLLWMLENAEPDITTDSLEELAELYAY